MTSFSKRCLRCNYLKASRSFCDWTIRERLWLSWNWTRSISFYERAQRLSGSGLELGANRLIEDLSFWFLLEWVYALRDTMAIETMRISLERLVLFRHAMKRLWNRNVSRGFFCSLEKKEKSFSVALYHNKDNENNKRNDKKKNTMRRKERGRVWITSVHGCEHYRSAKECGPVFDLKLLCRRERQLNIEITYARRLGFMKQ